MLNERKGVSIPDPIRKPWSASLNSVSDRPLRGREGSALFHQVSHLLLETQAVEAVRLSFWEQWRKGESRRLGDRKAGLNP